jgi:S1-C subfamily serine protease
MIDFFCPVCKTAQRAAEQEVGSKKACTHCGQRLQVPKTADLRRVTADQTVPGMVGAPMRPGDSSLLSLPGDTLTSDSLTGFKGRTKVKWFYVQNGKKIGPVFWPEMLRLVSAKEITPVDLVWSKGMKQWQPAKEIAALWGQKTTYEKPVGKPLGRGTQWKWIAIGSGAVAVVVTILVLLLVLPRSDSASPTKESPSTSNAPPSKPSLPVRFVQGADGERNQKDLTEAVALVVVGARLTLPEGKEFRPTKTRSIFLMLGHGSGFTFSGQGHLITNEHVIRNYVHIDKGNFDSNPTLKTLRKMTQDQGMEIKPEVWVFFGSAKYPGKVLHVSDKYDMSVLKVERNHSPYFKIADDDNHIRGMKVFACGFPGTALGPMQGPTPDTIHEQAEGYFQKSDFVFVQTDGTINKVKTTPMKGIDQHLIHHNAKIHGGNSGGPLIGENGMVVGINTWTKRDLEPKLDAQGRPMVDKDGQPIMVDASDRIYYAISVGQLRAEIKKNVPGVLQGE